MTQLTASDGHQLDAYEVAPDGATAAIVIVQEIFGVNSHIRSAVDRVELDYNAEGVEQGRARVSTRDL